MAQEQKQPQQVPETEEAAEAAPEGDVAERKEAARRGRRRDPRRDRRRARGQRRGLREVVHPEGRRVSRADRSPARAPAARRIPLPGTSSFTDFLAEPGARPAAVAPRSLPQGHAGDLAPHGTTIVAATFPGGVVMAGDRRATMGNIIAQRDIEKVFPADEYSCVGIAGTAGLAVEMVRLFQVELEHYEKIEGTHAVDGRQGQPARRADPRQPRHGHAGPGRRAAVRRLRPAPPTRAGSSPTTSPAAATRRPRSTRSAPARCSPAAR